MQDAVKGMCRAFCYFKVEVGVLKIPPRLYVVLDHPMYEFEGREQHEKALA